MKVNTTVAIDGTKPDRHDVLPSGMIVVGWGQNTLVIDGRAELDAFLGHMSEIRYQVVSAEFARQSAELDSTPVAS